MAEEKKFRTLMDMDKTWKGAEPSPMADEHESLTEPPPASPSGPPSVALLRIDPKKFLKAWEDNVDTQRALISSQLEQKDDNIATRKSNSHTRWEMRVAVLVLIGAAAWVVAEQRATRATIKIGATVLDRVDDNVATMTRAQGETNRAMTLKAEADLELNPDAEEIALEALFNAQEVSAEAEITIAQTRKEAPPEAAVKARDSAREKKFRLKHPLVKMQALPSLGNEE